MCSRQCGIEGPNNNNTKQVIRTCPQIIDNFLLCLYCTKWLLHIYLQDVDCIIELVLYIGKGVNLSMSDGVLWNRKWCDELCVCEELLPCEEMCITYYYTLLLLPHVFVVLQLKAGTIKYLQLVALSDFSYLSLSITE